MLTFGTNASLADPKYSGWISTVGATAQNEWSSMKTNANRTNLWNDLNHLGTTSSDITGTYTRLRAMAMGYAVHGSSLESNVPLRSAIISGLDWMYTNYYNERITNEYDNWFDWEIGTPLNLNDIAVLLYSNLSVAQIANYMNTVDHFTNSVFTPVPLTSANKVWKASVAAVSGVVAKSAARIANGQQALSDVFPYSTSGDGFYPDGSFVFHSIFAYNGGYGAQLIGTLGPLIQLLAGSSWQITDPQQTNLFRWVYDSFEPFIYRGALMQMTDGRYYSRQGDDHVEGHGVIGSILRIAQFAPPADAAAYKSLVKSWIQTDTYRDFIQNQSPPFNVWAAAVMNDPAVIPAGQLLRHYQFSRMDQALHLRPGWGFAVSMSSSRSGNFESIRGENLKGWYTGDGMTYLYNADLAQFADDFWSTINPYRLPGTTVDAQPRADGSGQGYLSPNDWVGGASLQGLYGLSGMQLNAWNSSLTARKSWFMFGNEIVCLGSSITSTDNFNIETIVENRRLAVDGNNLFTVNGATKPSSVGWSETLTNIVWGHLAGTVPGADIGYFFPQPATVKALREPRAGAFSDLNITYGATNRSTRNYLTVWFDHGVNPSNATYAYVLLPGQTAAQVASYAANPNIVILKNTSAMQGVKEAALGLTAVNFWKDSNSLGGITVDKASSVILRNDGSFLEIGVSDPTQTNTGIINLEITNVTAMAALSWDPSVTVVQTNPTIKLAVNVNGAGGQTFHARFFAGPVQTITLSPVADAYVESGTNANVNFGATTSLIVKTNSSSTNLTREAYLRFDLPPAPGMIFSATLRLVPVAPFVQSSLWHALSLTTDNSWNETGITWNNKPSSTSEFTRWLVPTTSAPVQAPVTALAQQAAAADGKLSVRISTGGTNTAFTAYASKESGAVANRPQLILALGRVPPSVVITNPVDGSVFDAPAAVALAANAQDVDGPVTNVDFYIGPTRVAQLPTAPYSVTLSNLSAGQYTFCAVATDIAGLSSTSAPVAFSVYNPQPLGTGVGLTGQYYTNLNFVSLARNRTDPTVNFSTGPTNHLSVRWTGKLQAEHAGLHLFHVVSDGGARLWVNGQLLVDDWNAHSTKEDVGAITLLPGEYYDLRMEYFEDSGSAVAQLWWTQPGRLKEIIPQTQLYPAASGLVGSYVTGTNLTNYLFTRIDGAVNFSWGASSNSTPDPTLLPGAFSANWTGKLRAKQGGTYTFYTLSAGGVRFSIALPAGGANFTNLINNWTPHTATENSATVTLVAGQLYRITLDYFNTTRPATMVLMWAPPGESKQVIPQNNFTPLQDNNPPMLDGIANTDVARSRLLSFAARATDLDQPYQSLAFSLDPGAPPGANINAATGLFTWTPLPTQALGGYNVTVRVTDNGIPVMTDAQTFVITVTTNLTAANVMLVPAGALWRYLDNGTDQGAAWRGNNFNDAGWKNGFAQLGYGSGHETTVVGFGSNPVNKYITTYFRRAFYVPDASLVESLTARLLRDDGAVVYLNGIEVWRDNMPDGPIMSGTVASSAIGGPTETNFLTNALSPLSLISGANVIAIEIHQDSPSGADVGFDFELWGRAAVPSQVALAVTNAGGTIILKWPSEAALYELYTTTNLLQWIPVPTAPAVSNNLCVLPLPATNQSRFYRLQTR